MENRGIGKMWAMGPSWAPAMSAVEMKQQGITSAKETQLIE